ncbi:MAG: hypothetical protein Q9217_003523 [Psora testacea]
MSSSERPRTPPRSSHVEGSIPETTVKDNAAVAVDGFMPHVFDLMYPTRAVNSLQGLATKHIPQVFLGAEAVDSSVLLGQGATFSASLQVIPEGPKRTEITSDMGGLSITRSTPAPVRPRFVVYKTARVAFDKNGQPLLQYRRVMQSVLTELHALIYPPLFQHANIIDLLGFAWGSNPFSTIHRLPAIIVEYAEHGTLADLLSRDSKLAFSTKHMLCLDVARGLAALHQAGLVHGDVKAENVLIFAGSSRKYLAKIADFGFSVVQATESGEIWMGGTRPWMAPEILQGPIQIEFLRNTDTFSFGLLSWLVCIDGRNPFDLLLDPNTPLSSRPDSIEQLKLSDKLLELAKCKEWFRRFTHEKCEAHFQKDLQQVIASITAESGHSSDDLDLIKKQFPNLQQTILIRLSDQMVEQKLIRSLNDILHYSLQPSPGSRDLDIIIAILESDVDEIKDVTNNDKAAKLQRSRPESSVPSTVETRNTVLGDAQSARATEDRSGADERPSALPTWTRRGYKDFVIDMFPTTDGPNLFILAALYMNGYGCATNAASAWRLLRQAADLEHDHARAFLYRILSACDADTQVEESGINYLFDYAAIGSRAAFEELRRVGPAEKAASAQQWLINANCGVGAPWFNRDQMLHGHTHTQWFDDEWCLEQIKTTDSLPDLVVNKRGDTVLHFVAMCGRWRPLKALVLDYGLDVNLRNPLGETPLLCACRSGQGAVTIMCLQRYHADASLAANNGETPLHWLLSFDDQYIEPLAKDLVQHGAMVDATTHERVSHSMFPGTIDIDIQLPGSPLSWAVHHNRPHIVKTLLEYGAEPHFNPHGTQSQSPMEWAAYFHHDECLRIMIEHLESKVTQVSLEGNLDPVFATLYSPLARAAVYAADKFSMILRHGKDYLIRLRATLDLLREKTKSLHFQDDLFQSSFLYYAVSGAHDDVVEYMFEHNWCTETLNSPVGEAKRTALLEAVRWNRKPIAQLLQRHGADIDALAANPFQPDTRNWSALHIFAHEGHNKDVSLIKLLVDSGLPIDGAPIAERSLPGTTIHSRTPGLVSVSNHAIIFACETPFAVAIRHNAFSLASSLLSLGADPNALTISSGLFSYPYALTILGHIILSNARYSSARLKYLLSLNKPAVNFIVEPERQLTALHRVAMASGGIQKITGGHMTTAEFDMDTNTDILYELLLKWKSREELNATCGIRGNTALHLAVESDNVEAIEAFLRAGADRTIANDDGEIALHVAEKLKGTSKEYQNIIERLR